MRPEGTLSGLCLVQARAAPGAGQMENREVDARPAGPIVVSLWSLALSRPVETDAWVGGALDGAAIPSGCGAAVCTARQSDIPGLGDCPHSFEKIDPRK